MNCPDQAGEIIKTLRSTDNEGTDSPYWIIIDPRNTYLYAKGCYANEEHPEEGAVKRYIESCITGPFFSREDAEGHLKGRAYAFSESAYVYCHSGYWSKKYHRFCRSVRQ